jgi:predicted metal-dependent peptidase
MKFYKDPTLKEEFIYIKSEWELKYLSKNNFFGIAIIKIFKNILVNVLLVFKRNLNLKEAKLSNRL